MIKRKFKLAVCCKCGKRDPEGRHIPADATDVTCFACANTREPNPDTSDIPEANEEWFKKAKLHKFTGRKPEN